MTDTQRLEDALSSYLSRHRPGLQPCARLAAWATVAELQGQGKTVGEFLEEFQPWHEHELVNKALERLKPEIGKLRALLTGSREERRAHLAQEARSWPGAYHDRGCKPVARGQDRGGRTRYQYNRAGVGH